MAIDPRIALGYQPPQIQQESPFSLYGQTLQIKDLMQRGQMREAQMREAQDAEGRRVKVRDILGRQPDLGKAVPEIMAVDPETGIKLSEHVDKQRKSKMEFDEQSHAQSMRQLAALDQYAGMATDQSTYEQAINLGLQRGDITPELAALLPGRFDPAKVQQFRQSLLPLKDQLDLKLKEAQEARAAAGEERTATEFNVTLPGKAADAKQKVITAAQFEEMGMSKSDAERIAADAARAAETARHNRTTEKLTAQGQYLADARARDNTKAAEKPLNESAVKTISELNEGLAAARELRRIIQSNSGKIGPVAGLWALNPWASESRALQAQIDLVRQRIGKALEGGVLRKEDEEKYKKILPTLRDTPTVANSKLDSLEQMIGRDLAIYEGQQQRAGRRITPVTAAPTTAPQSGPAPGIVEDGYRFKGGNPADPNSWEPVR
jgi:hypothetical protein